MGRRAGWGEGREGGGQGERMIGKGEGMEEGRMEGEESEHVKEPNIPHQKL